MHSNDFRDRFFANTPEIDGKTKEQWEEEFGVVGLIASLHEMGWTKYQWSYEKPEDITRRRAEFEAKLGRPAPADALGCFAEFFSNFYRGYLRGDGATVREAVERCVATAQRYEDCRIRRGHEYVPYKQKGDTEEYKNGLLMCKHCGFAGHTSMVKVLQDENRHLKIMLDVEREQCAQQVRYAEENGESYQVAFARSMKACADHLASKEA